jgi:hypothetical protein
MLKEIIESEKRKAKQKNEEKINLFNKKIEKMMLLLVVLNDKSDGYMKLGKKFFEPTVENMNNHSPRLVVENINTCVDILDCEFEDGEIKRLKVGGLSIFPLMGEWHTLESFFKKIAIYLK